MSKSLNPLLPGLGGTAAVLAFAYVMADQFVVEIPAPARGELIAAAEASDSQASTTPVAAEAPAMAQPVKFDLGRPATAEEVAAWDIDVRPDGLGLPEGKGDVWTGDEVFAENCAVCHGDFGEAVGRWPVLAGGQGSLTNDRPVKTIGSYWPYLSTVFDYVYRAMPFGNAQSLTADEVYAITAYLLYVNDLVDDDFELSHENFTEVRLPNEENFFMDDRDTVELAAFSAEPCMTDCKDSVEITGRAAVVDVTPEDAAARKAREQAAAKAAGETGAAASDSGATAEPVEVASTAPATEAGAGDDDAALVAAGEKAFKKCSACHAVGEGARNKSGPQLNAVVGRPMGGVDGFKYSSVLTAAHDEGRVWDEESLAAFLAKPRDYLKGTKMAFGGFKKQEEIDAVIAYLSTFGE